MGLVFGCVIASYDMNMRLTAAAELYRSGKIRHVLVSGDNGTMSYNEPRAMKRRLAVLSLRSPVCPTS